MVRVGGFRVWENGFISPAADRMADGLHPPSDAPRLLIPYYFPCSFFHFLTAIMNFGMAIMRPMREGCR